MVRDPELVLASCPRHRADDAKQINARVKAQMDGNQRAVLPAGTDEGDKRELGNDEASEPRSSAPGQRRAAEAAEERALKEIDRLEKMAVDRPKPGSHY